MNNGLHQKLCSEFFPFLALVSLSPLDDSFLPLFASLLLLHRYMTSLPRLLAEAARPVLSEAGVWRKPALSARGAAAWRKRLGCVFFFFVDLGSGGAIIRFRLCLFSRVLPRVLASVFQRREKDFQDLGQEQS